MHFTLTLTIDWNPPSFEKLPDEANFVTLDMDGTYCWWEHEPSLHLGYWSKSFSGSRYGVIDVKEKDVQIPMPIIRRD